MGYRSLKKLLFLTIAIIYILIADICTLGADSDFYREKLEFDINGQLIMTTHDKKATTNVTYKTIGITIKRYDMPVIADYQQIVHVKLKKEEVYDDPDDSAYVYCFSYGDKDEILNNITMVSESWKKQLVNYGDTVYIDEIMTVCEKGVPQGGMNDDGTFWGEVYFDYEGISNARNWYSPQSLLTHFNKSVQYHAQVKEKKFEHEETVINEITRKNSQLGNLAIGHNEIGREEYDVTSGVPTGETLYINGNVTKYAYKINYQKIYEVMKLPVKVTTKYILRWTGYDGTKKEQIRYIPRWYLVTRTGMYWQLSNVDIKYLTGVTVQNYAFENIMVNIGLTGNEPEIVYSHDTDYTKHVTVKKWNKQVNTQEVILEDYSRPGVKPSITWRSDQELAEKQVGKLSLKNDMLKMDGREFTNDNSKDDETEPPANIYITEKRDVYKKGIKITDDKVNSYGNVSVAQSHYKDASLNNKLDVEISGVNPVSVHTPVCVSSKISNSRKYNQLVNPDDEKNYIVLGRGFGIKCDYSGEHLKIKGYGQRDYKEFVAYTEVKFPFEVYCDGELIEKDQWIKLWSDTKLVLPVGVSEGSYRIMVRSMAKNCTAVWNGTDNLGNGKNLKDSQYGAYYNMTVEVIGRMYDLLIGDESSKVGTNDENGVDKGIKNVMLCNINKEKNKGISIPLKLTTIGDLNGEDNTISIRLKFYMVENNLKKNIKLVEFKNQNGTEKISIVSKKKVLKQSDKTCIGSNMKYKVKDENAANLGVQKWSGKLEFSDKLFAVDNDVADDTIKSWNYAELCKNAIRAGTFVINLNAYTMYGENKKLEYQNKGNYEDGYCSMWVMEGYNFEQRLVESSSINIDNIDENNNNSGFTLSDCKAGYGDAIQISYANLVDKFKLYRVVGTH